MNRFKNALKQIKFKDLFAPIIFLFLLIPSLIFRLINKIKGRKLWLISEDGEARDNGYHFYKYVREKHPKDFCFYAINKKSAGYEKVKKLGNTINYRSLKHWFFYMSANLNISSQKSGNPCPIFWYPIHVTLGLYKNRVFLQHGITQNDSKWLYYNKTKFKKFICGTEKEYNFIKEKFGYSSDNVILAGFSRWDALKNVTTKEKSILIMPTWRNWLCKEYDHSMQNNTFLKSDYYKKWNELLNNDDFIKHIEKNNITVYFYPHIRMRHFLKYFKSGSDNIKIVSEKSDIQEYFNKCNLMITDYSSVSFDFAYLNKPVIYYQFDIDEYRKKQLQPGYFNYKKDGFGPVVYTCKDVMSQVKHVIDNKIPCKNAFPKMQNCSEKIYNHLTGKREKIKIMEVVNSMNIGGIEMFLMRIVRNLKDNKNYEFVFLTNKPGEYYYEKELNGLGARFIRIKPPKKMSRIKHLIELRKVLKAEKPDIIHCHTYFDAASVMLVAKQLKIKTRITHSHTAEGKTIGRKLLHTTLSRIIRKKSTKLIACSKEAGEALYGKNASYEIMPNMIDTDNAKYNEKMRSKIRKSLGIKDNEIVIGHVGRLAEVKNHKFLIEIFNEIKKQYKNYKMLFVGDGELRHELETQIKKHGYNKDIILLGNRSDVMDILNALDIFVFPSIYEGLPTVLIEAQDNGLPIVASSSISHESKINNNFEFVDLEKGAKHWSDVIINTNKGRIKPSKEIEKYSTISIVKQIEAIYNGDVK